MRWNKNEWKAKCLKKVIDALLTQVYTQKKHIILLLFLSIQTLGILLSYIKCKTKVSFLFFKLLPGLKK